MSRFYVYGIRLLIALGAVAAVCCTVRAQSTDNTNNSDTHYSTMRGAVTLKVPQFEAARRQIGEIVQHKGGEIKEVHTDVAGDGRKHGWIQIVLPAEHLPEFLVAVHGEGTLYAERVSTTDQTSEYESLGRRTGRLREHQERLDGLLKNSRRLRGSDILYVQERLFRAAVDESQLEQMRSDVSRQNRVATVHLALFEPISIRRSDRARIDLASHFHMAQNNALKVLYGWGQRATTGAAYLVVFSPFWGPVLLFALLVLFWIWRRVRPLIPVVYSAVRRAIEVSVVTVKELIARRTARPALTTEPPSLPPT